MLLLTLSNLRIEGIQQKELPEHQRKKFAAKRTSATAQVRGSPVRETVLSGESERTVESLLRMALRGIAGRGVIEVGCSQAVPRGWHRIVQLLFQSFVTRRPTRGFER